jgi:uncharacterized protein (TIGR00255 family)
MQIAARRPNKVEQMADVASMTGFSDSTQTTEFGAVTVEMKSVNGRFLELSLRLPDELRYAEGPLRERITAAVARGKVDCRVALVRETPVTATRVNETVLAQIAELWRQVHASLPQATPLGVADILRWPGVIESAAADPQAWRVPLMQAAEAALAGLQGSRVREGTALRAALLERCDGIVRIISQLREVVPRILAEAERRLHERLSAALGTALAGSALSREEINDRIRQELSVQGMRADIAEEMDRLGAHVQEVRRTLAEGGAVGRRLDFLMQELNREANTIGSKASAVDMSNAAVELKLLIEQMREQVQNLE